jgi:hypothetical protein
LKPSGRLLLLVQLDNAVDRIAASASASMR